MLRVAFAVFAATLHATAAPGSTLTIAQVDRPDFVDPAISYTTDSWQMIGNAYTPLLTYAHEEGEAGTRVIPGLAEALPSVSADGRTYTLTLRPGLKYANGRSVRPGDFEHSVKRVLNLESGGAPFFFGIAGAQQYARRGHAHGDISGISARGRTITVRLRSADPTFIHVLAMPFASLVPSSTPFRNTSRRPPPGAAPYAIASVRGGGSRITLRRNKRFSIPGIPAATIDRVVFRVTRRFNRVGDLTQEATRPAAGRRFRTIPTLSTYYFFLNHRVAPFDREDVRHAVALAMDPAATKSIFDGLLEPSCAFLPPGIEGHADCPVGAPNLGEARRLVEAAGARGKKVTVFGNGDGIAAKSARYLVRVLDEIGLDARVRLTRPSVYFQTVGNRKRHPQAGFANWFADYAHPRNFLFLVDGRSIQATNNQNFGEVNDPDLNAGGDYATANRLVVERWHVIPYGHRLLPISASSRVPEGCDVVHFQRGFDLARACVR